MDVDPRMITSLLQKYDDDDITMDTKCEAGAA